jgi:hypothetical protein
MTPKYLLLALGALCLVGTYSGSAEGTSEGKAALTPKPAFKLHFESRSKLLDLEVASAAESNLEIKYKIGATAGGTTVSFPGKILECVHCFWDREQGIAMAAKIAEGDKESYYFAVHWFSEQVQPRPVKITVPQGKFQLLGITNPAGDTIQVWAIEQEKVAEGKGWVFAEFCPISPDGGNMSSLKIEK